MNRVETLAFTNALLSLMELGANDKVKEILREMYEESRTQKKQPKDKKDKDTD